MYKISILGEGRKVPFLGTNVVTPVKQVEVTGDMYRRLLLDGFSVARLYNPQDFRIMVRRGDHTLFPGQKFNVAAKFGDNGLSENIEGDYPTVKDENTGKLVKKYPITWTSSSKSITIDADGNAVVADDLENDYEYVVISAKAGKDGEMTDDKLVVVRKNTLTKPKLSFSGYGAETKVEGENATKSAFPKTIKLTNGLSATIQIDIEPSLSKGRPEGLNKMDQIQVISSNPSIVTVAEKKDGVYTIAGKGLGESTLYVTSVEFPEVKEEIRVKVVTDPATDSEEVVPTVLTKAEKIITDIKSATMSIGASLPFNTLVKPLEAFNKKFVVNVSRVADTSKAVLGTATATSFKARSYGKGVVVISTEEKDENGVPLATTKFDVEVINGLGSSVTIEKNPDWDKENESSADKLADAKVTGVNTINALVNLDATAKKTYTDKVNVATKAEDVQPIVDAATKADSDVKTANDAAVAAKALQDAKVTGVNTINALVNLDATAKKTYTDQVNATTKPVDVQPIVDAATKADADKAAADAAAKPADPAN